MTRAEGHRDTVPGMTWWGWLLLTPLALVGLLALVLLRSLAEDAGDRAGARLMNRKGMAERTERRPVAGRVGLGLMTLGLIPYLVVLTGLLSFQDIRADASTLVDALAVGAALIGSGALIVAIWWRLAAPD
jgi:hypothetical protein